MARRQPLPPALRNRSLARPPGAVFRGLTPLPEPVPPTAGRILHEARGGIEYAYFPAGAVLSAPTVMPDGNAIEAATIGDEGPVGHRGAGGTRSPHRALVRGDPPGMLDGAAASHARPRRRHGRAALRPRRPPSPAPASSHRSIRGTPGD